MDKCSQVKRFFILSLFFSFSALASPEIWLLSGKSCNVCDLFDEISQNRGYGDVIEVSHIKYPVRKIDKASLPKFLENALKEETQSRYWDLQLTVAIVDGEKLVYQGNVAESADFSQAFLKPKYMRPKRDVTLDELHHYGFNYPDFFRHQFNLEYFVNVALHGFPPHRDNELKLTLSTAPNQLQSNISLWGSAQQPAKNGLFLSTRINQLKHRFSDYNPHVIFGHGKNASELDTLLLKDEKYSFVKAPVVSDFSADLSGLKQWFSAIKNSPNKNELIIQVGHSGPNGAPVWGHVLPISRNLLKSTIEQTEKDVILVSGACHSGLFAGSASCGFYAAHPDAIATGCQTSLSAIDTSDDYLKFFFAEDKQEDINGDGKVSFNEAHWYASSQLERHNISYTDEDAIIDTYFSQHPAGLEEVIALGKLKELANLLSPEENYAVHKMANDLPDDTQINLTDYVSMHKAAIEALKGKTELPSVERNEITALKYPLNLVMLARRALYKKMNGSIPEDLEACESRGITEFVQGKQI